MKNLLVKNIHLIILLYAGSNLYTLYTEKTEALVQLEAGTEPMQIKITKEGRKLKQIEEFKKNLEVTKNRVKEVVTEIEKVQKQLPEDLNAAVVQEMLSDLSEKLRIKGVTQTPGNETTQGFYFTKEYNLKAIGTYLQGLILLENIEKSERILNVKSYEVSYAKVENRSRFPVLDINLVLESYRYNKSYKERSGVEEIENKFKN